MIRLLLAALVAGCAGTAPPPSHPANVQGESAAGAASDFTLRDVDGRDVRLSDFAGKVVLIDFWATWCTPCEAEIPHLQRLHETYSKQGLVVLGIAMDGPETVANVAPFVRRNNLTYTVLLDEETKVVAVYNPKRTAPLTLLIDRSGKISRVRQGYDPGDEKLIEDDVKKLLGP